MHVPWDCSFFFFLNQALCVQLLINHLNKQELMVCETMNNEMSVVKDLCLTLRLTLDSLS